MDHYPRLSRFASILGCGIAIACGGGDKNACKGEDVIASLDECTAEWEKPIMMDMSSDNLIECLRTDERISDKCSDCLDEHRRDDEEGFALDLSACGGDE